MRLIDADALSEEMKRRQDACEKWMHDAERLNDEDMIARANGAFSVFIETKLTLEKQPTVDAVEVVRCKECKHYKEFSLFVGGYAIGVCTKPFKLYACWIDVEANDYCSRGERRSE